MRQLYLDIENTIIESLDDPVFMDDNCEKIKRLAQRFKPERVNIFTWGWTRPTEIDMDLVTRMYDRLEITEGIRGKVYTKSDSVDESIREGWLDTSDRERALYPGMMGEFGISKLSCFQLMCEDRPEDKSVLVDDLVTGTGRTNRVDLLWGWSDMINPEDLP